MDPIEMLKNDHLEVRDKFLEWDNSQHDFNKKSELAPEIMRDLVIHMDLEEKAFYPAIRNNNLEELVIESLEEHKLMKNIIGELKELDLEDEEYDPKMKVLQEIMEEHIDEEEASMFPEAQSILAGKKEELFREMEGLRSELEARV